MKHNGNRGTQVFIDVIFNVGLHPIISNPARITSSTNSLIDNVFTNCINDDIYSGLLINDLSDSLPIFIVNERNMNHNNSDYQPMHIKNINENTLQKFKMLLNAWNKVLIENDTNKAYYISSEHFLELYDTCTQSN